MVICKYFQNGNCRFGSKCVNEHIDIKQIIKSEVEAAVKGSQWPLSCFGPFKEKTCIPNFIDDQSFEEIRHLCYEAKKQNCFPQFQQQFSQQVLEAQNKMNQLLSLNPDIVNIITQIYESGTEPTKGIPSAAPSNPFSSMGTQSANNSGIFGNNQIQTNPFAKPTGSTGFGSNTPVASSSIFGSGVAVASPSSGNIFGSNTQTQPSIFGGGSIQQPQQQQPQQQQQSNPFGGGFTAQQQTGSIFATQTPQQQTSSIFGANANQNANNFQSNPAFGGNTFSSTNNSSTPGIFASNQPTPSSNIFQQANTGNIFAQGQANVSQQPFGQQPSSQQSFGQQQAIQQPNPAFSNPPTQNKAFAFSSFLQNPNQPTPSQTQPQGFGQPQTGNQGIFLNSPQPQSQSIFAQAIQDQQQQQQQQPQQLAPQQNQTQQNIFGQPVQNQPQAQPFAQPLQNTQQAQPSIFSNQQQQQPQQQQQQQQPPMQALNTSTPNTNSLTDNSSQNIFAQATNALIQESLQSNNQQQFGTAAGSIGQQMMKNDNSRPGVYSKLESLSNAALEAYKADRFIMGKIPTEPPPKELCF